MKPVGALAAGAALAWAGWVEPRRLVTVRRTLELPGWPAALDGVPSSASTPRRPT